MASLISSLNILAVALVAASVGCGPHKDNSGPTACASDAFEPNDTEETAKDLGALQDDPDSKKAISASVHLGSDDDWYRVHVADTGLGGDPIITVAVSSGFDVSTWFVCDGRRTALEMQCLHGSSENQRVGDVEGCRGERVEQGNDDAVATMTTNCEGTSSDDGVLFIRVRRPTLNERSCSYDLSIAVE